MKHLEIYIHFCLLLTITFLCNGCSKTQPDELPLMAEEVLKHNQGVSIEIKPIAKDK